MDLRSSHCYKSHARLRGPPHSCPKPQSPFSMATSASYHHRSSGGAASYSAASTAAIPSPPPPTPSNHSIANPVPSDADAALSRFLHQVLLVSPPPLLPLPRPRAPAPLVSLRNPRRDLLLLPSAAADLGFFHLADHGVPAHLHASALRESRSLLASPSPPDLSPLAFPQTDDDEESDPILVLDVDDRGDREGLRSLAEYGRCLKRAAMGVVGMLAAMGAGGFEVDPFGEGMRARCLMWVSTNRGRGGGGDEGEETMRSKAYPYVVGLRYESGEPSWVHGDSGEWVAVEPRDDSVLVTLGDIAQVWSNGRFKKVRGVPQPSSCNESSEISITLLLTLPLDTIISPLSPLMEVEDEECEHWNIDSVDDHGTSSSSRRRYHLFLLDEYAWRVYHERPPFKDPLIRYRI